MSVFSRSLFNWGSGGSGPIVCAVTRKEIACTLQGPRTAARGESFACSFVAPAFPPPLETPRQPKISRSEDNHVQRSHISEYRKLHKGSDLVFLGSTRPPKVGSDLLLCRMVG